MTVVSLSEHRAKTKANCQSCKHMNYNPHWGCKLCLHPAAATVDRVRGVVHPRVDGWLPNEKVKTQTDKCDEAGWFEEKKSWWERIFP